jgi:hypothetical protein
MAEINNYQIEGINTYTNPLIKDAALIHAVNVDSYPYGGKSKRNGYETYLGTPDNGTVNTLFSWTQDSGTQLYTYRASGSALYYSNQGTGAWTLCGNGTIANGAHVEYGVLNNTLTIVDGAGSTRHSTDGTSFTDTTLAPVGISVEEYQNRIYIAGTASSTFWSTANDSTNWSTSGTSDSLSLYVPGEGKMGKIFKTADRLFTTKNSGLMHRWDGYSRADLATNLGPSSQYSLAKTEDYCFWINRMGHYGFGGDRPQLLSNAVQNQFYNKDDTGISNFTTVHGAVHRYDYLASIGTVTDPLVGIAIPNAILKYDYQKNEYLNWTFANAPTAFHSYRDTTGKPYLIFGDSSGQCYKLNTSYVDNASPIQSDMIFVNYGAKPNLDKEWKKAILYFNPGCEATVQYAYSDTFEQQKTWYTMGDALGGKIEYRFDAGARGSLLFLRITDNSTNSRMIFYGYTLEFDYADP